MGICFSEDGNGGNDDQCRSPDNVDTDGDGVQNCKDPDDDNDILSDAFEFTHQMDSLNSNQDADRGDDSPVEPLLDGLDLTPLTGFVSISFTVAQYDWGGNCDVDKSSPETYLTTYPLFKVPGLGQGSQLAIPPTWSDEYWDDLDHSDPTNEEMKAGMQFKNRVETDPIWNQFTDDATQFANGLNGKLEIKVDFGAVKEDDATFDWADDSVDVGPSTEQTGDLSIDRPTTDPQKLTWNGSGNCFVYLQLNLHEELSGDMIACALSNWDQRRQPGDVPCNL